MSQLSVLALVRQWLQVVRLGYLHHPRLSQCTLKQVVLVQMLQQIRTLRQLHLDLSQLLCSLNQ